MRMTFDPQADAAYLRLAEVTPGSSVETVAVERAGRGDVVLDFDADGYLLGIEVIGAGALLRPDALREADRH